jgi:transposase
VYDLREFYRGKKVTLIGAVNLEGVVATRLIAGSMNGDDFETFIKSDLVPQLEVGAVVVMDNLNSHHREGIAEAIESVGARVLYLPTYSPDFNPIEMMWSQIKSMVRLFRTRTVEALTGVIKIALSLVPTEFLKHWFTRCCYCAE